MYKLAILDDVDYECHIIEKEIRNLPYQMNIVTYTSPLQLHKDFEISHFDIVCLDIEMPEMSGFDLAEKLKSIYRDVLIIFITSHDSLLINSINYRPIGFISKNDFTNLEKTFEFVMKELYLSHTIFTHTQDNITHNIQQPNILYFQKKGNDLFIYTTDKQYKLRKSLKDIETSLNPKAFVKINKSTLINIRQVRNIDKTNHFITLTNNKIIPFSRIYKNDLIVAYRETIIYKM